MEYKVRALDIIEPKSVQQVEQELLEKHEQEMNQDGDNGDNTGAGDDSGAEDNTGAGAPIVEVELKDEDVLSYIGKRYNKQINSLDDLLAERENAEVLPEDVAAYMKYKK